MSSTSSCREEAQNMERMRRISSLAVPSKPPVPRHRPRNKSSASDVSLELPENSPKAEETSIEASSEIPWVQPVRSPMAEGASAPGLRGSAGGRWMGTPASALGDDSLAEDDDGMPVAHLLRASAAAIHPAQLPRLPPEDSDSVTEVECRVPMRRSSTVDGGRSSRMRPGITKAAGESPVDCDGEATVCRSKTVSLQCSRPVSNVGSSRNGGRANAVLRVYQSNVGPGVPSVRCVAEFSDDVFDDPFWEVETWVSRDSGSSGAKMFRSSSAADAEDGSQGAGLQSEANQGEPHQADAAGVPPFLRSASGSTLRHRAEERVSRSRGSSGRSRDGAASCRQDASGKTSKAQQSVPRQSTAPAVPGLVRRASNPTLRDRERTRDSRKVRSPMRLAERRVAAQGATLGGSGHLSGAHGLVHHLDSVGTLRQKASRLGQGLIRGVPFRSSKSALPLGHAPARAGEPLVVSEPRDVWEAAEQQVLVGWDSESSSPATSRNQSRESFPDVPSPSPPTTPANFKKLAAGDGERSPSGGHRSPNSPALASLSCAKPVERNVVHHSLCDDS